MGAGLAGRWHAHASHAAGGRIAAVVDEDLIAARTLARRHRAASVRALEELRDPQSIDVVHICTPASSHEQDVRRALTLRVPLIVEKPVAQSASGTEQLIAAAGDAGTWIQPVHQLLFQDGIRQARRWLEGPGVLRLLDYRLCSAGADRPDASPDGIAADVLPHPLSLIDDVGPRGLSGVESWHVSHPAPGELNVVGVAGETVHRIFVSMHGRPPRHDVIFVADRGTLTADLFHGFSWTDWSGVSRVRKAGRPLAASGVLFSKASSNLVRRALKREFAFPGLSTLIGEVYRAAMSDAPRPIADRHMVAVARSRDAILEAIRSRGNLMEQSSRHGSPEVANERSE